MLTQVIGSKTSGTAGEYLLLFSDLPGHGVHTIGVLLLDPSTDILYVRLRRDWESVGSEDDMEVLVELSPDLEALARESGGAAVLERLENEASQSIRVSNRESISVIGFEFTLSELYRRHVPSKVLPFRTHLPRTSLAVAAGPFLSNPENIGPKEWVEAPEALILDQNMFVARIQGRSMEPAIRDGSLCVFRSGVVGPLDGRLVLVRNSEESGERQYTVKRYKTERYRNDDGTVEMVVWLESLNPSYSSWKLEKLQGRYHVIAEFIKVLD